MTETFAATHPDDPHRLGRSHWLRAAVLGATDGIVSISSLLIGVAAAVPRIDIVLAAGVAGLVAGAMSIAAIWRERGLSPATADQVAHELTQNDVLEAQWRD